MLPKRGVIALITTLCALVLLFTFKTPTETIGLGTTTGTTGTTATITSSATPAATTTIAGATPAATNGSTTPDATPTATTKTATTANGVVNGTAVSFRFGTVQVQITVKNGAITDITTLQAPDGGHSGQISSYAIPILQSEALSAKNAQIDLVSGATYTSDAYAQSLQSALDQAGL